MPSEGNHFRIIKEMQDSSDDEYQERPLSAYYSLWQKNLIFIGSHLAKTGLDQFWISPIWITNVIAVKTGTKSKPAAKGAKIPAVRGIKTPAAKHAKTPAAGIPATTGNKKQKISDSPDDDPFGDVEAARRATMHQRQNGPLSVDAEEDPFGDIAAASKVESRPGVMSAEEDPFGDEALCQPIRKPKAKVRFVEQEQSQPVHWKRKHAPEPPTSTWTSSPPAASPEPPNALETVIQAPVRPFCRVHIAMDGESTSSCSGNCLDPEV